MDEYDKHKFLELVMCLKKVYSDVPKKSRRSRVYIVVHDGVITTKVISRYLKGLMW